MAHLFSKIVLQDALKNVSIADIENKIAILTEWNAMYQKWELQKKKETAFEATYSEKLFWTILGYNDVGGGLYTREKHPKNASNGQTCDIGLGYYASDKNDTQAVVELKDAGTSIDRPQQREGNMTPIQQGFKYKPLYNSRWVIVSNYYEIRLYRDTYQDYETWTLADLVNPANDYEKFRIFYLLLRSDTLISESGESETEKLLAKVRIEQETITKKFYKEYSGLRAELMRDIWKNNPKLQNESVVTITQRIIDRIVFVHFCEDRGLLPQNKLAENLTRAKEIDLTPWEVLILYFRWIDKWSDKLGIPDGYNGGLFRDDNDVIKNLKVSDEVITKFIELGRYDFSDEGGQLSVEILGHIFEQSISDLESIRAKIKNPGVESDEKKVSKRKKDGIFYTPAYIVDYIVRNSLGKYLEEHEERLKEKYKLKGDIAEKTYRKREIEAYTEYQKILHTVKVLDPACGSGAFLVRVFDFLLEENKRIANILTEWVQSDLFQSEMYFREILKNNIYGVDLNEESVEITKLSLWLKSAVRGKKLETLDNNIKCGNSLIDDPAVAGDKAFNWNTEFADIMESGGFDVIVGNPPYTYRNSISDIEKTYFKDKFLSNEWNFDLYKFFIEELVHVCKKNGYSSFIVPNTFLSALTYKKLREVIINEFEIIEFFDLGLGIFENVVVESVIFTFKKNQSSQQNSIIKINRDRKQDFFYVEKIFTLDLLKYYKKDGTFNIYLSWDFDALIDRIQSDSIELGKIALCTVWINTGYIKDDLVSNEKINEKYHKMLNGKNIGRNFVDWNGEWIMYDADFIKSKGDRGRSLPPEYIFTGEKILVQRTRRWMKRKLVCYYDDEKYFNLNRVSNIVLKNKSYSLKYVYSLLNSELLDFYFNIYFNEYEVKPAHLAKLPIKNISLDKQRPFIEKADLILSLNRDLQEKSSSFLKNIQAKYSVPKITRKLEKWWELDFAEFLKETKISISLTEQEELMQYFETRRAEVRAIDAEIRKTDAEIDTMIFDLYGLTEEERKIILNS